jgi:hypothetical protein
MSNLVLTIFLCGVLAAILYSGKYSAVTHKAKQLKVSSLLRASAQWGEASRKEKDPVLALVHSSTSLAYLDAARGILGDEDIEVLHDDIDSYVQQVTEHRERCVRKMRLILQRTLG